MKDLAPRITRQRLIIEGFFQIAISRKTIIEFFKTITKGLNLRTYGTPTIHATGTKGKAINQGFDAFIPLIDSGIALYIWGNAKFFSVVVYTCKKFSNKKAIKVTKSFFKAKKIAFQEF